MKKLFNTIQIEQGIVVVDEKDRNIDWYIDDTNTIRKSVNNDKEYWAVRPNYYKVIATKHFRLSPDIPMIVERSVEDVAEDLAVASYTMDYDMDDYCDGFVKGYIAAQSKSKEFSLEEAKIIWKAGQEYWKKSGDSITFEELTEKIKNESLTPSTIELDVKEIIGDDGIVAIALGLPDYELKTTSTPDGLVIYV